MVILAVFLLTAVVTAVWPEPTASTGTMAEAPSAPFVRESHPVEIPIPAFVENPSTLPGYDAESGAIVVSPFLLLLVLTGAVVVPVIGVGVLLNFGIRFAEGFVSSTKESELFKESMSDLESYENEKLQSMREGKEPNPAPSHKMPRWTMLSNWLIFSMFSIFIGYIIGYSFDNPLLVNILLNEEAGTAFQLSAVQISSFVLILCATVYVLFQFRPQRLEAFDKEGNERSIPWDFIAVLLTGLVVVGLGIAYMVYLNTAPLA